MHTNLLSTGVSPIFRTLSPWSNSHFMVSENDHSCHLARSVTDEYCIYYYTKLIAVDQENSAPSPILSTYASQSFHGVILPSPL